MQFKEAMALRESQLREEFVAELNEVERKKQVLYAFMTPSRLSFLSD